MLLIDQRLAYILMWNIEVDANHQATSANINDMLLSLLKFFQLLNQVCTYGIGVIHEILFLEYIKYGEGSCTSQMIASKGRSQLPVDGLEFRGNQHGSHGETVGDALGHGDDVWTDTEPLVGEELATSSVATLYLVTDKDRAILLTGSSQTLCKLLRGEFDTAHTLDAFQDDGTDIALRQFFGLFVTSTASEVRPWNAFSHDSTLVLPFVNEASFRAFSFASAPELIRNSW